MTRAAVPGGRAAEAPGWQVWAALLIVYVVWGSTYLGIRVVVETMPALISGGIRFAICAVLMGLILAIRKGESDLAMGNALGSCLFNAGGIFGLVGLVSPPTVNTQLTIPVIFMGLLAVALIPISRTFHRTISRVEGGLLLASYIAFLAISGWQASRI